MSKPSIARGALLGAFVGDASGATLEFLGRKPNNEDVERALSMVGGGSWRVAPGQITDDGELALGVLARSLTGAQAVDRDKVAEAYVDWFNSDPFDCGNATGNAFGRHRARDRVTAHLVEEAARRSNMASKANGALMRSIGLGIWSWRLSPEDAANAARGDARLSHPNPSCQHANAAYVVAVRHLVLNAGDSGGAFRAAGAALDDKSAEEVGGWLREAESGPGPPYHPNAGFVRIAFTHAFRHLRSATPFVEALRETLRGGGDTDTNGCIVGGLLGALHGEDGILERMRDAVVKCDTALGRPRPDFFSTRDAASLADRLAVGQLRSK
jgi:ADP-ribosyl-[dinitrogen reductase] hydrolase